MIFLNNCSKISHRKPFQLKGKDYEHPELYRNYALEEENL